jgi:hypothetical protein
MTQQHHDPRRPEGIPLSAVYRQLDDHPVADAAGYDPAATVAQLLTSWASDDLPASPEETVSSPVLDTATRGLSVRADVVAALARRRFANTITAYAAILVISGIAATTAALIPHLTTVALTGIGAAAILLALMVVLIHTVTMHSMVADHDRLLGHDATISGPDQGLAMQQGEHALPESQAAVTAVADNDDEDGDLPVMRSRRRRFSFATPLGSAAGSFGVLALLVIRHGTAGFVVAASIAGSLFALILTVLATALFASQHRSERAFIVLKMMTLGLGAKDGRQVAGNPPREEKRYQPRQSGSPPSNVSAS